mmetsp:Transcript_14889/g.42242  ORF Transcript_14889/g.42242 Transcript_14889/m.42242 type:complete len:270 (-) Transcript_14889:439-1248(-)
MGMHARALLHMGLRARAVHLHVGRRAGATDVHVPALVVTAAMRAWAARHPAGSAISAWATHVDVASMTILRGDSGGQGHRRCRCPRALRQNGWPHVDDRPADLLDLLLESSFDRLDDRRDLRRSRGARVEDASADHVRRAGVFTDVLRLKFQGRVASGEFRSEGHRLRVHGGNAREKCARGVDPAANAAQAEVLVCVISRITVKIPTISVHLTVDLFHPDDSIGEVRAHQYVDQDLIAKVELVSRQRPSRLVSRGRVHPERLSPHEAVR